MTSTSITVRHNFETAHRLPFLGGKCTNLHGHSWWAEVEITGAPDADGVLIDFGTVKRALREWIDTYLDHGAILGAADPLVAALVDAGSKVFVFDPTEETGEARLCAASGGLYGKRALPWPTVENVAELIRRVTLQVVDAMIGLEGRRWQVTVRVQETHVNAATAAGDPT